MSVKRTIKKIKFDYNRPWDFFPIITNERFKIIKESIKKEFKERDKGNVWVSKDWLIESLCQCIAYMNIKEKGVWKK